MLYASQTIKSKGFSILEALLLMIIIAVVASTSLPKLGNSLKREKVTVEAIAGEFDNAVRLARAQWFSNGGSGAMKINGFGDGQVWSGQRGWPISHHTSEAPRAVSNAHCAKVWNGVMHGKDAPRASVETDSQWRAVADSSAGVCTYKVVIANKPYAISYSTRSGKVSYL